MTEVNIKIKNSYGDRYLGQTTIVQDGVSHKLSNKTYEDELLKVPSGITIPHQYGDSAYLPKDTLLDVEVVTPDHISVEVSHQDIDRGVNYATWKFEVPSQLENWIDKNDLVLDV